MVFYCIKVYINFCPRRDLIFRPPNLIHDTLDHRTTGNIVLAAHVWDLLNGLRKNWLWQEACKIDSFRFKKFKKGKIEKEKEKERKEKEEKKERKKRLAINKHFWGLFTWPNQDDLMNMTKIGLSPCQQSTKKFHPPI